MSEIRVRARVSGRVQGVWFRESTRRKALELGLRGWVRNCPDGSVEAVFEGEETADRSALEFVREGPPLSRVLGVDTLEEHPGSETLEASFSVR